MTLLCVAEMSAASGAEVHEEIGVDIGEKGKFFESRQDSWRSRQDSWRSHQDSWRSHLTTKLSCEAVGRKRDGRETEITSKCVSFSKRS